MVTVNEVRGQKDGNDEGEKNAGCNDSLTHVITKTLWKKDKSSELIKINKVQIGLAL